MESAANKIWGRTSDGHEIIYPLKAATYNANGSPATGTAFSETTTSWPYGYVNLAASNDKKKFIIHFDSTFLL
jgi:hypothetical protein